MKFNLWNRLMFLHVTQADYIKDHSVRVWFNDGSQGDVDLSSSLDGPIFEPLRDLSLLPKILIGRTYAQLAQRRGFRAEYLRSLTRVAAGSSAAA